MTTDISEKGLETIIMRHMTGTDGLDDVATMVAETPDEIAAKKARGIGYWAGNAKGLTFIPPGTLIYFTARPRKAM